jgi:hypothetical protein
MDYKEIIKNTKKFHYFIRTQHKIIHLSSSNSKSEAKELALKRLDSQIDKLIDKKLILIKIKQENPMINNNLQLIGGNISFIFEDGKIKDKKTIKNINKSISNKIYLTNKYIKKYKDNLIKDYKFFIPDFLSKEHELGLIDIYKL